MEVVGENLQKDVLLVFEVTVEGPCRDPRGRCDVGRLRPFESVQGEDTGRGAEQRFVRRGRPSLLEAAGRGDE